MSPVFEVPIIVGIKADSREAAHDEASDIADALQDVFMRDDIDGATALELVNDDDFDRLKIKRGGE